MGLPVVLAATSGEIAQVFLELGAVVLGLALLARLAGKLGLSPIPFYLFAGLAVGTGGVIDVVTAEEFIEVGAEIGVLLLLLTLGLEYTAEELGTGLRRGVGAGAVDLVANGGPGVVAGLVVGWDWRAALLLGGITYVTSSGVVSKVLADLDRLGNRETPGVLSLLVIEDLVMAAYLPVVAVILAGTALVAGLISVAVALATVAVVLFVALRYGTVISRLVSDRSDEVLLLSVVGLALLVGGIAQQLQVSSAIGAFLVGIAVSGPAQQRASSLIEPLRDLFAALFFLFFSLQIDPASLLPAAPLALILAVVTAVTKMGTGWWAAARQGIARPGRLRAGTALVARGEFSIVIAGLGVSAAIEPELGATAAAYVLMLAVAGPVLTRYAEPLGRRLGLLAPRARPLARARGDASPSRGATGP